MAMTAWLAKFCDQFDLFVGEWAHLLAVDGDSADQLILLEHRNDEKRPKAAAVDGGDENGFALDVSRLRLDVSNVDRLPAFR